MKLIRRLAALAALLAATSTYATEPPNSFSSDFRGPVLTDTIQDVILPKDKLVFGADGSYVDVSSSNPLPVALSGGPTGMTVNQGTGGTSPWLINGTVGVNNFPAIQACSQSGTWTVQQGTPPWLTTITNPDTNYALESGGHLASVDAGVATLHSDLGTVNTSLGTINTTLGSPFQAGGLIGNTAFGISGTLPAFASPPTVNLGTIGAAATNAELITINTTLGSPFQAGGSIGNTAFGISGTLPAFAATPTFNLGTLNGAATAANQVTAQASLSSIDSKLTSPLAVTGTFYQAVQPVSQSGTFTVQQGSPPWSVTTTNPESNYALETGGHLASIDSKLSTPMPVTAPSPIPVTAASPLPVTQSTSPWVVSGTVASTQSGTWTNTVTQASGSNLHADIDNFPAIQPVSQSGSWTVTANAGTNPNTSALALESGGHLASIDTKLTAPLAVTGTFFQSVQPVSQSGAPWSDLSRLWDGTNSLSKLFDLDTSGTTHEYDLGISLRGSNSGGSFELGTSAHPVRIDPVGTTTQPVSVTNSTLAVTQSGTWTNTVTQSSGANLHADIDNFPTVQPVSGTVTANIGTTGGLALDTSVNGLLLPQASTTSGQSGPLIQGAVSTAAPTYTTAKTSPLSLTTAGALRTDASATTQPISGTVTANAGTGTFQTNVTNASIPVTQSGTWNDGRTWTLGSGTDSVSSVQSGTWTTGRTWSLLNSTDSVNAVQSGAWTTGRTWDLASGTDSVAAVQSGTWNLANITGTISLPTGAATSANQSTEISSLSTIATNTSNTQGSVTGGTAGTKSDLVGGTYVSTLPTLTTGQQDALLLDSSGRLLTDGAGVVQPVSQSGTWTTGRTWSLLNSTDSVNSVESGTWNLNNISGTISLPTNAAQETGGNLAAINGKLPASLGAKTSATSFSIVPASDAIFNAAQSGTWTTGRTWNLASGSDSVAAVQSGTWTTGRTWALASGTDSVAATQSGTWTVQQGSTPTTLANAWPVKPTDGTNAITVKAASTAAASTDTAEVVALSPNTSLPAGTATLGSIANISGTISLPTGASTSALQTTANTSLASIDAGIPASLGSTTSANSMPVVIASDQAALPLPTGASTSANQTGGNQKTQIVDGSGNVIGSNGNSLNTNAKIPLTANSPGTASIGTSSTSILAANASRKGLYIMNGSTATIYIGIGTAAVLGSGITLLPGGSWYMDEFTFTTAAINGIATAASSAVEYQEFQ